ncbi:hypothetical protein pipiens_007092 [Culex pipiens pipiens]|uniref:Uncharacterized protein n=1 Tax=Culex pipiens pipiens TaxID=38569 RepID=A0ABD1DNR9_CULPP
MMINTPRHPTVNNLQQLIDARINVKVDYRSVVIPYGDESPLAKLVTHDIEHLTEPLDGVSAYFLKTELAEALIHAPKNVDPATREPRYVALDERFIMSVGFYTIGIFTLYDRLKFTQRVLFETGIRQLWKRNFRDEQYTWLNEEVVALLNDPRNVKTFRPLDRKFYTSVGACWHWRVVG